PGVPVVPVLDWAIVIARPHVVDPSRPPVPWRLVGRTPKLRILVVASQDAPFAKTGGLPRLLAALPEALDRQGHRVTVVISRDRGVVVPPGQTMLKDVARGARTFKVAFKVASLSTRRRVVFVDIPALFDRDGYYTAARGDFPDNAERFAVLATAALDFAE